MYYTQVIVLSCSVYEPWRFDQMERVSSFRFHKRTKIASSLLSRDHSDFSLVEPSAELNAFEIAY